MFEIHHFGAPGVLGSATGKMPRAGGKKGCRPASILVGEPLRETRQGGCRAAGHLPRTTFGAPRPRTRRRIERCARVIQAQTPGVVHAFFDVVPSSL